MARQSTNKALAEKLTQQVLENSASAEALIQSEVESRLTEWAKGQVIMPLAVRGDYATADSKVSAKGLRTVTQERTYGLLDTDSAVAVLKASASAQESAEGAALSLCYHILTGVNHNWSDSWEEDAKSLTKVIRDHVKAQYKDDAAVILNGDTFRQARAAATKAVAFNRGTFCMLDEQGMLHGRVVLKSLRPKAERDEAAEVRKALELLAECDLDSIKGSDHATAALQNIYRALGVRGDDAIRQIHSAEEAAVTVLRDAASRAGYIARRNLEAETATLPEGAMHQAA